MSLPTLSWGLNITISVAQSTSRWHGSEFRLGAAANTFYTVHGDRQHPFGSRATVRKPRETRRSSGPGLCVPALRLVCRFEDEDAAGPSSAISGNCPSFERVPVGPETGLPKISVKEEKLSLGGRPLKAAARPMGNVGQRRPMSNPEEIARKELQTVAVRYHVSAKRVPSSAITVWQRFRETKRLKRICG